MTPGFLSSSASSAQFGSGRRRKPYLTPAGANDLFSIASSVRSPGSGQLSPAATARFRLSWTVLRAIPSVSAMSRVLVPSPASRSICRSCLMAMPTPTSRGLVQAMAITESRLTEDLAFETIAWEVLTRGRQSGEARSRSRRRQAHKRQRPHQRPDTSRRANACRR